MSLSVVLSTPEARRVLGSVITVPASSETIYGDIRVSPRTGQNHIIGTAFDYLMRFLVERLNPHSISGPWVAESAIQSLKRRGAKGRQTLQKVNLALESCQFEHRIYLETGSVSTELLAAVLKLAQIDHFVRSRSDSIAFTKSVEAEDELRALYSIVPSQFFVSRRECILNPTFGAGSTLVGGADADLLLDDTLIEIKTTVARQVDNSVFQQLISYVALAEIGGVGGQSQPSSIESIGVYSARYGCYNAWHIEDIVEPTKLQSLVSWFQDRQIRRLVP